MNKYCAYYRCSTEQQGRSNLGLLAQQHLIKSFFKDGELVKEFQEVKSGKNVSERPILQQAIKYCLENDCYLIVAKQDRLSRNVDDLRAILKQLNGKLYCADLPRPCNDMLFTIMAAVAEAERKWISERTKAALAEKIKRDGPWQKKAGETTKNGKIQSQSIANGQATKASIESRRKSAQANPNNIRAKSVIKDQLKQGLNPNQIAKHLNRNQFTTSTNSKFSYRAVQLLAETI